MNPRPRLVSIEVNTCRLGEDYVFHVTGGQAHIGAAATAYMQDGQILAKGITVPHHREAELAMEWARLACEKYNRTVTVIMGVHIDKATKEEIRLAVQNIREAMKEALS